MDLLAFLNMDIGSCCDCSNIDESQFSHNYSEFGELQFSNKLILSGLYLALEFSWLSR